MKIEPASPFSNGMSYEYFEGKFCYRCKKGKLREDGFPEFPEHGGCPIWDAMEFARFGEPFPSDKIVRLRGADGKVKVWEICTEFETGDKKRMEAYRRLFEDTGGTIHAKEQKEEIEE